jgi:hypothetical protein
VDDETVDPPKCGMGLMSHPKGLTTVPLSEFEDAKISYAKAKTTLYYLKVFLIKLISLILRIELY